MQQLDVKFFAQMKGAWHNQLWDYKQKDPTAILLRKTEFPQKMKELVHGLPSVFRKCGLYPLNSLEVLNRIPSIMDSHNIARNLDNSLLETLEVCWFGNLSKMKPRGHKIPAGQSYSAQESEEEDYVEVPSQE
jgi:hypothetical protein